MKLSGTESVALGRRTDAASALSRITSITARSARQQQGIEAVGIGLLERQLHREGAFADTCLPATPWIWPSAGEMSVMRVTAASSAFCAARSFRPARNSGREGSRHGSH